MTLRIIAMNYNSNMRLTLKRYGSNYFKIQFSTLSGGIKTLNYRLISKIELNSSKQM